ncbi:hypothetical protein BDW66DRAFT_35087 [Aspergillus desertorum]
MKYGSSLIGGGFELYIYFMPVSTELYSCIVDVGTGLYVSAALYILLTRTIFEVYHNRKHYLGPHSGRGNRNRIQATQNKTQALPPRRRPSNPDLGLEDT